MREAFALVILLLWSSSLFAQAPFYEGKTIRVIVGSSPGNTQDQMTRLTARHLPKYIPGNPTVMVENMGGASSMIAANYLFKVSKPDGLTMGVVSRALYFDQLVGRKEVQFDWAKFTWIGSPVKGNELLFVGGNTPYKSIRDVVKAADPPRCGASGTTSTGYYIPKLINEIFGTKFHIVTGYSGGAELDLAVERVKPTVARRVCQASPALARSKIGVSRVRPACSYRPAGNVIQSCPMFRPFTNSWTSLKPRSRIVGW